MNGFSYLTEQEKYHGLDNLDEEFIGYFYQNKQKGFWLVKNHEISLILNSLISRLQYQAIKNQIKQITK